MERFSKENIDRLVLLPKKGLMTSIRGFMGPVVDFSGLIAAVSILAMYIIFRLDSNILILSALGILGQLVLFYYIFIKFNRIKINEYRINLKLGREVSFAYISDFHLGTEYSSTNKERLKKIIEKINSLNVELVLLGGDFLTHKIEPELLSILQAINAKTVLAVFGNHDAYYLEQEGGVQYRTPDEFLKAFSKSSIPLLINENKQVTVNGIKLTVAGIPDLYSKTFNIIKAFEGADQNSVRILLSHNPDVIDFVEESDNIDLILSGHNHSGQIFFPFIGAVLPMPTKRKLLTKGIFQINNRTKLLLSQGIGFSGSRLRINTDPEICLITLY